MKKNVLALSITAALFGLTGGAQAMTGTLGGATAGSNLALNGDGVGHILLIPYFSAQSGNNTLINLVNTSDPKTGVAKAVKVRFRGAANSDDIFDFQVFLSPGDVWTANVSQGANGLAQLTTSDNSCTKPAKADLNRSFVNSRLQSSLSDAKKAAGTREGYIEIFTMADIPKGSNAAATKDGVDNTKAGVNAAGGDNPLFTAVKHVNGTAPCSGAAWTALDGDGTTLGAIESITWNTAAATNSANSFGLVPPTTGLMANWTIINTVGAASWSGEAFAIESRTADGAGVATTGNVVYWPQTGVVPTTVNNFTADPLLRTANVFSRTAAGAYAADTTAGVTAGNYDLPDVSTPYTAKATPGAAAATDPMIQARSVTAAIAATSATNEFLTTASIGATTDWVFSMPTRRYSVALDYAAISATDDGRRFTDLETGAPGTFAAAYFNHSNTVVKSGTETNDNGSQICVKSASIKTTWADREENSPGASATPIVSPSVPTDTSVTFCGEATVLSINNGGSATTGSLKATVAVKDLDVTYKEGWMKITTPSATTVPNGAGSVEGLPVLGSAFVRAVGASGGQTFGAAYKHRFAR